MLKKLSCFFLVLWTASASAFYTERPKNFFIFTSEGFWVFKSKITSPALFDQQEIGQRAVTTSFSWNHMVKKHTGLRLEIGQEYFDVDWKDSFELKRQNYNAYLTNIGVFSDFWENWWIFTSAGVVTDPESWSLSTYAQYRFVLYTRYNYRERFRVHLGALGYYGMKYNRIIPIVGIDFSHFKHLTINLVFPNDISLVWEMAPSLSLIARYRFMLFTRRLDTEELRPKGGLKFSATGAEIGVRGTLKEIISVQGFIGRAFNKQMRFEDNNGKNRTYYDQASSFYAGGGLFFVF